MARRGMNNEERFGLDSGIASATETVKSGPLYLWQVIVTLNDTNATGTLVLADGTSSAALTFGTTSDNFLSVRLGSLGASAGADNTFVWTPPRPLFVKRDVVASATNATVCVYTSPGYS